MSRRQKVIWVHRRDRQILFCLFTINFGYGLSYTIRRWFSLVTKCSPNRYESCHPNWVLCLRENPCILGLTPSFSKMEAELCQGVWAIMLGCSVTFTNGSLCESALLSIFCLEISLSRNPLILNWFLRMLGWIVLLHAESFVRRGACLQRLCALHYF